MAEESAEFDLGSDAPITRGELRDLLRPRNSVRIKIEADFDLDDSRIYDLNGEGLTITAVTTN